MRSGSFGEVYRAFERRFLRDFTESLWFWEVIGIEEVLCGVIQVHIGM